MSASSPGPARVIVEDMAWCWWTRPRATRIGDIVYLAAIDHDGGMVAATFSAATGTVRRARLAAFEDDDHNNPALLAVPGRPLLCFYSRHDAEEGLRYRISTDPIDIDRWHPERTLGFGGSTTYAQVHAVGDEVHLLTRVDETRWSWRLSPDWGATWNEPRDLLSFDTDQQVYLATALCADGRTLRLAVSGHPKDYEHKPLHDVWAATLDLVEGTVSLPTSGEAIGNLRTGAGLPLDYRALECVQQTPPDRTVNLFDVSSGPVFEIGFVSKLRDDNATRDGRHHYAALRDGHWLVEDLAPTGGKFGYIDAGFYVGSMAFPERAGAGQVYLTREEAGQWHLEFWRRDTGGRWSARSLVTPSPVRLARPWPVSPPTDRLAVVALALERYAGDSYYGSLSHLVGAALPEGFVP